MAKSTAVQRREPTLPARATDLPEHLKSPGAMRGLENAKKEDFVIPRLAVCQNMSPAREKNKQPGAIKGLEEGMFFNTLTQEIYGEVEMLVTPLMFYRNRWYIDSDGNVLCFSPDSYTQGRLSPEGCERCPHSKFIDGEKPACTLFNNVPVLIHHVGTDREPEIAVVSMKGANLKPAREWNTRMRLRNHDVFGGLYVLRAVSKPAPQGGSYYIIEAENAGIVKDADLFHFAEAQYEQLSKEDLARNETIIDVEPDPGM